MVTITSVLGQEIVERTMKIIPFNVNVMDSLGIIIGSGNPERIGTLHPGAQLVLGKHSGIEIDSGTTSYMPGVKEGINLPLSVRGEICGVVGITGNPDEVRQFGELVRIAAEMILEQAQLIEELQHEKRYREEFVYQLINKTGITDARTKSWAARLGVDFRQSRAMFVLEITDGNLRPEQALTEFQRLETDLAIYWPSVLTAIISPREMVMLENFELSGLPSTRSSQARKRLQELSSLVNKSLISPSVLSMGLALPGLDGPAASYEAAKQTSYIGKLRTPEASLFSYYDLSLPVLLSGLESGWQAEQLRQSLQELKKFDRKEGILFKTLSMWFRHNNHPILTANALHIHRNTLDYRLKKISELTGLDLSDIDSRLLLYVALQLRDHEQN